MINLITYAKIGEDYFVAMWNINAIIFQQNDGKSYKINIKYYIHPKFKPWIQKTSLPLRWDLT